MTGEKEIFYIAISVNESILIERLTTFTKHKSRKSIILCNNHITLFGDISNTTIGRISTLINDNRCSAIPFNGMRIVIDNDTLKSPCLSCIYSNIYNWTRISINGFKSGAGLSENHFNYPAQEYPDYEIIDIR
jgi:hypothetical protein